MKIETQIWRQHLYSQWFTFKFILCSFLSLKWNLFVIDGTPDIDIPKNFSYFAIKSHKMEISSRWMFRCRNTYRTYIHKYIYVGLGWCSYGFLRNFNGGIVSSQEVESQKNPQKISAHSDKSKWLRLGRFCIHGQFSHF